jgi:SulP family sulfate permease
MAYAARQVPSPASFRRNSLAGLTVAISSVPDAMAAGVLAGVNPIFGLYAAIIGPIVGGFVTSAVLMVVTTTSAAALVSGEAIAALPGKDRDAALFTLVVLAGVFQIIFGLLRFGSLTRFVSYSVMTGFLAGVAALLILSQLPIIAGLHAIGGNRIAQLIDLSRHVLEVDPASIIVALGTGLVTVTLRHTRLKRLSSFLAILLPSVLVLILHLDSVKLVRDSGDLPAGLPRFALPAFGTAVSVLTGALSLAFVVLVQGAGVSQSVPNPDRSRPNPSRDFFAQGLANVAAGLFGALPVGGSHGATAINVFSNAGRRWAAISSGIWLALIVVALPAAVERVALPALGAILILAGFQSVKRSELAMVWHAGWVPRLGATATFVATVVLPIQAAVALGVVLSAALYFYDASNAVTVVELVARENGDIEERPASPTVRNNDVTVLAVYGHLFFAGARTLERLLPDPSDARNPVVILRLRGHLAVGATLVAVLSSYADRLRAVHGRLYLSGIGKEAYEHLTADGRFRRTGAARVYAASPIVFAATREAVADAQDWLETQDEDR